MEAQNAPKSFKCEHCGNMFEVDTNSADCPVCGFNCSADNCRIMEASDEGY